MFSFDFSLFLFDLEAMADERRGAWSHPQRLPQEGARTPGGGAPGTERSILIALTISCIVVKSNKKTEGGQERHAVCIC